MAQLVLGAIGAVAGTYLGVGPMVGWAIGSAIGGAMTKPSKVSAPTQPIMDLKVTGTEYGQPIPYVIGTVGVAGQMWWNTDRQPHTDTQTSGGGKGGGGQPEVETSITTYTMDALYGVSDNIIVGIRRVWANGKLIWSAADDSDISSLSASQAEQHWTRMTVYTGDITQLPDPTYAAAVGSGYAPAYRGRGSVFIEGLKLGTSGAIPNLTFEVVVDGSTDTYIETWTQRTTTTDDWKSVTYGGGRFVAVQGNGGSSAGTPNASAYLSANGLTWSAGGGYVYPWAVVAYGTGRYVALALNGPTMYSFDGLTWVLAAGGSWLENNNWRGLVYAEGIFVATGGNSSLLSRGAATSLDGVTWTYRTVPANNNWVVAYGNGTFVGVGRTGTNRAMSSPDGVTWTGHTPPEDNAWNSVCYGAGLFVAVSSDGTNRVMTSPDGATWTARAAASAQQWRSVAYGGGRFIAVASNGTAAQQVMTSVDGITWTLETAASAQQWQAVAFGGVTFAAVSDSGGTGRAMNRGAIAATIVTRDPPAVSTAVSRLCVRSGLVSGQIDVTSLSSISRKARSMAISQIANTRQALDLLMSAYFFELTVSDKLYFRPRGSSSVAAIPYLDLGAGKEGESDADPLPLKQSNELEIPALVAVNYINVDDDYQTDTQYSDRLISSADGTTALVQMALGLTPSEAKGVADVMLLDQSVSRLHTSIALLGDYCALEPTDPVTITGPDGSAYRMRLVQKTDGYPLLAYEAVLDDVSILTSQGITSADYSSSTSVAEPVTTLMELMDIPILQDADNNGGFYVAVKGDGTPFTGAVIYSSPDNVTYDRRAAALGSAVFGTCSTTLGNWAGARVFDEQSSVTVDVGDGELLSSTRESLLANAGSNAMLVGSEIIQFATATLVSAGVYTLSSLLRGCRGTEWAMTGHVADERCVLITSSGFTRVPLENSELGLPIYYKGVTLSRPLSTADAELFTDSAIGLKPFSPIDLRASRDGSNDITFTWQHRSRLSTRSIGTLGINVPVGEAIEAYEIDVYFDGTYATVVRTISSTTPTTVYTAAEQTADGLTPGDPVFTKLYQLSAIVGRGYALTQGAV